MTPPRSLSPSITRPRRRAARDILWPAAIRDDDAIGGKAAGLLGLYRGGLPVPAWFVVSPSAFTALERAGSPVEPGPASQAPRLPSSFLRNLRAALGTLCPEGEPVAVRSSAADEDGGDLSYAGQCETLLSVRPQDVPEALARVWRSGFAARVSAYRKRAGHERPAAGPAVIVQRQIDARISGVAFSADPVSGRRGLAMVSAVPGLGESLVSGRSDADTWTVDRLGVVSKLRSRDPFAPALLDDEEVRSVARLARAAERLHRRPQDIEWAFEEDRLYCLQSRPVTTLKGVPDPDASLSVWDCRNIVENYGGVTTPLTFSFVRSIYATAYRESARAAGVDARTIAASERAFQGMIGLIRGRIYYDLSQWHGLLRLLPGFNWNWPFLAHMLGIPEAMPALHVPARSTSRGRDLVALARVAASVAWRSARLVRDIASFQSAVGAEIRDVTADLDGLRPDELAARYRHLMLRIADIASTPTLNDFWVMVLAGSSRKLAERWLGDDATRVCVDLLALGGDSISSVIGSSLAQLVAATDRDPALLAILAQEPAWSRERLARDFPEFAAAAARHVTLYGVRVPGELKLETRTLTEDPGPLFRAVARLAASTPPPASPEPVPPAAMDRDDAGAPYAGGRFRMALLKWLFARARGRLRDREALRFTRARIFDAARRILMALGERLWALGLLDHPRDVLFLQVEEVIAFVEGQAVTTDLRGLAALRKAEFDAHRARPDPPVRFETRGSPFLEHSIAESAPPTVDQDDVRVGLGCSPGRTTGRVRFVEPPVVSDLDPGDVIVARRTDPGWVTLLPACGALAVEVGNPLSHAAIIARELGIPMVAALPGLAQWLRDGDLVEIDGSAGRITRLAQR